MYKALLAASLAMLVCCAAAAIAGPVDPVIESDGITYAATAQREKSLPLGVIAVPLQDELPAPAHTVIAVIGFEPSVSLSAGPTVMTPVGADAAILLDPDRQPAVIPLPAPLYAAAALLALTLVARRTILRAC